MILRSVTLIGWLGIGGWLAAGCGTPSAPPASMSPDTASTADGDGIPVFEFDPSWPKRPFPNQWVFGNVAGMAMDANDHLWVIHRPLSVTLSNDYAALDPPAGECCRPFPSVIEFDPSGEVVQAWGGPDPAAPESKRTAEGYDWPREHGLFVDHQGNVWTGGAEDGAATLTKLTGDGQLIFQEGAFGQSGGNADTENFGSPAGIYVDADANEVYVADGYENNRVIVLDADTGTFKRMWGAYGNEPLDGDAEYDPDAPPTQQFLLPVHCVELSRDGLVYVCDRAGNRIQVFRKDGTFVQEGIVAPRTLGFGAAFDIAFSADPDQRFLYLGDGANKKVWILRRDTLEILGSFGTGGQYAGEFAIVHALETDSQGNLYVAETVGGDRVQKFTFMGVR